jgi:hypothetical protein
MVQQLMLRIVISKGRSKINGDNLNNIRYEASRHFRNEKREYLKDKIHQLTTQAV